MNDLISRQAAIKATWKDTGYTDPFNVMTAIRDRIEKLPSAEPKKGKCKWCERLKERNLRIEYYWIDQEGCTASFSEPHVVATGIANFCPNCGCRI